MKTFTKVNVNAGIMFATILFLPRAFVFANIEINEVMYDLPSGSDMGREWIEVRNNSDKQIDVSNYKFLESGVNHKLLLKQGDAKIPMGGYAVIVADFNKFKIDWPTPAVTIFDSTFSLNNTSESLTIKDDKDSIVDKFAYSSSMGGAGNGKSLQKINGVWVAATPTPGAENKLPPLTSVPVKIESATKKISPKATTPITETKVPIAQATKKINNDQNLPENQKILYPSFVALALFVTAGSIIVYFVQKSGRKSLDGEDFEILE